jgi:hypothetical protein
MVNTAPRQCLYLNPASPEAISMSGRLSTINRFKPGYLYKAGAAPLAALLLTRHLRGGRDNPPKPYIYLNPANIRTAPQARYLHRKQDIRTSPQAEYLYRTASSIGIHTASSIFTPQAGYPHRKQDIRIASRISASQAGYPHRKQDIRTAPQAQYPHRKLYIHTASLISAPQA